MLNLTKPSFKISQWIRQYPRVEKWFYRSTGPEPGQTFLHHRRVYIVPTRLGFFFGVVLLVLLVASINYSLSLGYILTFLVGAMIVNGMNYTFRNLAHVKLRGLRAENATAGSSAAFEFEIASEKPHQRRAVYVSIAHEEQSPRVGLDVTPGSAIAPSHTTLVYPMPARRRGRLIAPRMRFETTYPLGMWVAWSYWQPDLQCLVYPAPEHPSVPLPQAAVQEGEGNGNQRGRDEFAHIREYQRGDSMRHIAWKAAARAQNLVTKEFEGSARAQLWLDLNTLPALPLEARLSRLAAWVFDCEALGHQYGLTLGAATQIEPGCGAAHRDQCLQALALYQSTEQGTEP